MSIEKRIGLYALSVLPDKEVNYDAMRGIEKIAETGFKTTQFTRLPVMKFGREYKNAPEKFQDDYNYDIFFRKAAESGLTVTGLNIDVAMKRTGSVTERTIESKKMIDIAAANNVPIVIAHGGEAISKDEAENAAAWRRLVEDLKELTSYATPRGITVAMEPGGPRWMVHGWKLLKKLMDEVGDDLKVNFDPANIEMGLESSSEALNVLKDKIVHCHLKDADIIQSNEAVEKFMKKYDKLKDEFSFAEWLAAVDELRYYSEVQHGCGRVDFPYLFSELKKAGYQGPFIIEREAGTTRFEDALAAAELAEKYLN